MSFLPVFRTLCLEQDFGPERIMTFPQTGLRLLQDPHLGAKSNRRYELGVEIVGSIPATPPLF